MLNEDALERAKQMRADAYMLLIDAIKGLKDATRILDERIQQDGPRANYSMNSDLLHWAQTVWRASSRLHTLDQVMEYLVTDTSKEVDDASTDARWVGRSRGERKKGGCRGAGVLQPED